jgi:hypothetical protein
MFSKHFAYMTEAADALSPFRRERERVRERKKERERERKRERERNGERKTPVSVIFLPTLVLYGFFFLLNVRMIVHLLFGD